MGFSYIVLGAGEQGIAAAYDLARHGEAGRITLADIDERRAGAAGRVNQLAKTEAASFLRLDARDEAATRKALAGHDVALSGLPYWFNLPLARLAIAAGVSFCDLGGNTDIVRQQHGLDPEAKRAGVRVVPDCGMGPGMGNTLGTYAMSLLDSAEHVYLYDGGIPQKPQPPWNYYLTFHVGGLTNEYWGGMTVLREGKLVHLPCFTELESIEIPGVGTLEAFVVAGGVSTAPWSFQNRLQTYQLKILRYPGTFAQLKAFSDLGLFDPAPIRVDGVEISPRRVFETLFEPQVRTGDNRDVCIIRARAAGSKDGKPAEAVVDLIDYFDEGTQFTAMQRTTGWHLSTVASMIAHGKVPIGAVPLELAFPGADFVAEARKRGFQITERVSPI
jgi:lysine 6-dehydrogenase